MHKASPPPDHRIKKTNNQGLLTKKDEFGFHSTNLGECILELKDLNQVVFG